MKYLAQIKLFAVLAAVIFSVSSCKDDDNDPVNPTLDPASVSVTINSEVTVRINGGIAPFTLSGIDESKAQASLSGTTLTVKGKVAGSTALTVTGADGGKAVLSIEVPGAKVPSLSTGKVSIALNETATVTVENGVKPYEVSVADKSVAEVTISDNTISVKGLSGGKTTVTVTGKDGGKTTFEVEVDGKTLVVDDFKSGEISKAIDNFEGEKLVIKGNTPLSDTDYRYLRTVEAVLDFSDYTFKDNAVPDYAFNNSSITGIVLPETIKTIGAHAFDGSKSITSVSIPASVTKIDDMAFWDCYSVTEIHMESKTPPAIPNLEVLPLGTKDLTVYVPKGSLDIYRNSGWDYYNINFVEE